MIESKYFSVDGETEDFATIRLNLDETFNGRHLMFLSEQDLAEFAQLLLNEHGLSLLDHRGQSLLCRKVKVKE